MLWNPWSSKFPKENAPSIVVTPCATDKKAAAYHLDIELDACRTMGKNGTKTGFRPITNGQCCQTLRANEEYVDTRPASILTRGRGTEPRQRTTGRMKMPVTSLSLNHLGVDNDACHNMCKNGTKSSSSELPALLNERARADVRAHKQHIVFQMLRSEG